MADVTTLDSVRTHLKFPDGYTDDDDYISNVLIPSATSVIERECDNVIPQTFEEYADGGDYSIWTRHTPILSVTLCEEGWGFTNYSLTEIQVNSESMPTMFAFSIDMPNSGKISRRSGGNVSIPFIRGVGNVHLIYEVGFAAVPAGLVLAANALVGFWYRAFLQDQSANDPYATVDDDFPHSGADIYTPQNLGVPMWLLEMIKPWRRGPIIG